MDSNLEPTLNFYIDSLANEKEALALLKQYPSLLGFSLTNQLKPRLRDAQYAGIVIGAACLT